MVAGCRSVVMMVIVGWGLSACGGVPAPATPAATPVAKAEPKPVEPARHEAFAISLPDLGEDASCGEARSAYVESWNLVDTATHADLTRGQFGMILSRSDRYFSHCRVPKSYEVSICAAVQDGHVRGATVATRPRAPRLERCIDEGVRNLSFPAHPRMDVTKTRFSP